jgi:hypothetical protein
MRLLLPLFCTPKEKIIGAQINSLGYGYADSQILFKVFKKMPISSKVL